MHDEIDGNMGREGKGQVEKEKITNHHTVVNEIMQITLKHGAGRTRGSTEPGARTGVASRCYDPTVAIFCYQQTRTPSSMMNNDEIAIRANNLKVT